MVRATLVDAGALERLDGRQVERDGRQQRSRRLAAQERDDAVDRALHARPAAMPRARPGIA